MAKGQTIEESFERLEKIIDSMENDSLSLDESFKMYKEGIKLIENCNHQLDKVEKQIVIVNDNGEIMEYDG